MQICHYQNPLGVITIGCENDFITLLRFEKIAPSKNMIISNNKLLEQACQQLDEYFIGVRKEFNLPLNPQGTPFMQKVWQALQKIPYGQTKSYQEIAQEIGNIKACRAVGLANNHNPIAIFIPCHRVIGKNGQLTGYRGGLTIKQQLLNLEQKNI